MANYHIYREQLANLYHGYALWEPDPGGQVDTVSVGDVGFIRYGRFFRLFNILLSEDHPTHERLGVPDGFEKLDLLPEADIRTLSRGNYRSLGVHTNNSGIGAQMAA
jgi:hypothetical protein